MILPEKDLSKNTKVKKNGCADMHSKLKNVTV